MIVIPGFARMNQVFIYLTLLALAACSVSDSLSFYLQNASGNLFHAGDLTMLTYHIT